jgi:ASC-1-like (ASCH) protein
MKKKGEGSGIGERIMEAVLEIVICALLFGIGMAVLAIFGKGNGEAVDPELTILIGLAVLLIPLSVLGLISGRRRRRSTVTHSMRLKAEPYEAIRSGSKTYELKLYDGKRQRIKRGDLIEFSSADDEGAERLLCRVLDIHVFSSFSELYEKIPPEKCGYTEESAATASYLDMEKYYDPEELRRFKACAIEISPVEVKDTDK